MHHNARSEVCRDAAVLQLPGVSWGHRWTGSYNIHTATAHQESCGGKRDFEISFMGGVGGLILVMC